jgi:hypothetical protein
LVSGDDPTRHWWNRRGIEDVTTFVGKETIFLAIARKREGQTVGIADSNKVRFVELYTRLYLGD